MKFSEEDLLLVRISEDKNSFYSGRSGEVVISQEYIGSGITYFEEALHALRDIVMCKKWRTFYKQGLQVQEFYVRVGETLGRYLSKWTSLEETFSGEDEKPRDLNDRETRHKGAKKLSKIVALESEVRNYLLSVTKKNYEELGKLFRDFQRKRISAREFFERAEDLTGDYRKFIVQAFARIGMNLSFSHIEEANNYSGHYKSLMEIINCDVLSEEDKREFILSRIRTMERLIL